MNIENTFLDGVKVLTPIQSTDVRGSFVKTFNTESFKDLNINLEIAESYYSVSKYNTIRGMHFQIPPFDNTKIVYVSKGSIVDVVLDLRLNSPTYGEHIIKSLDSNNANMILIPPGFAHGFLSNTDGTIVNYLQSSVYKYEYDHGIRYDSFGFDWKVENPIISKRDLEFKLFINFKTPFI
jgi:dTDP-4-dehydrorhamnose 3,5-epimerase